jgi:two-component system, cell cycle sensor histidine kinase and response regulator CckA
MLRSSESEEGSRPTTVLVVDDEASLLALVRTMLWRAGYTVIEASDGEQALRMAAEHASPIHILLTDVLMPGMNGCELAEKFKSVRPEAKVLYMTGYRDKVLVESTGRSVDDSPLLRKPFTAYNLIAMIEELLNGQSVSA